jgi:hypothetical protein
MRKLLLGVLAAGAVAGLGYGGYRAYDLAQFAQIGVAYAAKQTCSCLFVAGRDLASCQTDFDPGVAGNFTFIPAATHVEVTALGGVFRSKFSYTEGYGCSNAD